MQPVIFMLPNILATFPPIYAGRTRPRRLPGVSRHFYTIKKKSTYFHYSVQFNTVETDGFDASSFAFGWYAVTAEAPQDPRCPSTNCTISFRFGSRRFGLELLSRSSTQLSDLFHFPIKRSTCQEKEGRALFPVPILKFTRNRHLLSKAGLVFTHKAVFTHRGRLI